MKYLLKVDKFSSRYKSAGAILAIIKQYEFPPILYFSKDVSLDSLYGIC